MSLLSSFIRSHLINAIENEFVKHEPEVKDKVIDEMRQFSNEAMEWVDSKMANLNKES